MLLHSDTTSHIYFFSRPVVGLAFRLRDPDHLLGEREDIGITCALIPSNLPGIEIGKRHDPMGVPFHNGPNSGRDVFVPLSFIIGGTAMAGQGWRMLMESLAAGRAISLPSLSVGGAQLATRVVGAYATVREQFDTPIGRFEGIEEAAGAYRRAHVFDEWRSRPCLKAHVLQTRRRLHRQDQRVRALGAAIADFLW